jgi:hypothetical protein
MRQCLVLPLVAAALLAGCAASGGPTPAASRAAADPATCVALFRDFDRLERIYPQPRRENWIAAPPVVQQADRLRRAGCITRNAELAGAEALPVVPVVESGAPIDPIALHAGVVQSNEVDDRARAFFEARGVPARSVGSPTLGRRIYLGPFRTQGGLEGAAELARSAGFVAPYPAAF